MSSDISQALDACLSSDNNLRDQAFQWLEAAQRADLPNFMLALASELRNTERPIISRQQAGIQLKNCLVSKDDTVREQKSAAWCNFDPNVRNNIKMLAFQSLGTEQQGNASTPQVISAIATIEIPKGMWPDVMSQLVQAMQQPGATDALREAILDTIGYICEGTDPDFLEKDANDLLTVVIQCMRPAEASTRIRKAATTALLNSLEFCRLNFENESHRNVIMQTVCEATQCPDSSVKVAALECLVRIMSLYYQHMKTYMGALFSITMEAMMSADEKVALQGIEFWSNVCDEEYDLAMDEPVPGQPPERVSQHYCKGAVPHIVPILNQLLTKQEEEDDEEDWNLSKAASVCLTLIALCAEDDVLQFVVPFVRENVSNPQWQFRDAAVLAFGSVLEGPSGEAIVGIIETALAHIMTMMQDPSPVVKDTVAWLLGRIVDLFPQCVLNAVYFQPLIECLMAGLDMEPRVSTNCCWAVHALAENAHEHALNESDSDVLQTYPLSGNFERILTKLFQVTVRDDAGECNLRCAAYEALIALLQNNARDCYPMVLKAATEIINRLETSLGLQVEGREQMTQYTEMQASLCALLQAVLRQLERNDVMAVSDIVMTILLRMFNSESGSQHNVLEDALMAVSALIEALKEHFGKYMQAIQPYLLAALKNTAEYQVCFVAVGVVGDVCRSLGVQCLPFCDDIMAALMRALGEPSLDRSVKPHILSAFGDVAMAIGPHYKKYLAMSLTVLQQAAGRAAEMTDADDFDQVDHMNALREGILEAFTGILHALKGDGEIPSNDVSEIVPSVGGIVQFINFITRDMSLSESNVRSSLGLLGDLCSIFKQQMGSQVTDFADVLVARGMSGKEDPTRVTAKWAQKQIRLARGR
eukprot:m.198216 g.198216  ORF g.198216 m.198216 type:complete len:874 (-) comp17673_c0_seq1:2360-4981(-)